MFSAALPTSDIRCERASHALSPIAPVSASVLGKLQITTTGGHRMTAGVNDVDLSRPGLRREVLRAQARPYRWFGR